MRFDWLLLLIPTALITAFADPGQPLPEPSSENEWEQRADYDIDLAHTNIRNCNEQISKLQAAIDAINARCKCGQASSSEPSPATVPPTTVVRAAQPVRQFVKQCVNGVCRLVPVDSTSEVTTEVTEEIKTPVTTTWRRSYGSAGGAGGYGSAGGWHSSTEATPARHRLFNGRVRGLLCR